MGFTVFWKLADRVEGPWQGSRRHVIGPAPVVGAPAPAPAAPVLDYIVIDYYNLVLSATSFNGGHLVIVEELFKSKMRALLQQIGSRVCIVVDGHAGFKKLRTKIKRHVDDVESALTQCGLDIDGDSFQCGHLLGAFDDLLKEFQAAELDESSRAAWLNLEWGGARIVKFIAREEADDEVRKFVRHRSRLDPTATFHVMSGDASLVVGIDAVDRLYICKPGRLLLGSEPGTLVCDRVCVATVIDKLNSMDPFAAGGSRTLLQGLTPHMLTFAVALFERDDYVAPSQPGSYPLSHFSLITDFCCKYWNFPRGERGFDCIGIIVCCCRLVRRLWSKFEFCRDPATDPAQIFLKLIKHIVEVVHSREFDRGSILDIPRDPAGWRLANEKATITAHLQPRPLSSPYIASFAALLGDRVKHALDLIPFSGLVFKLSKGLVLQYDKLVFGHAAGGGGVCSVVPETERFISPLESLCEQLEAVWDLAADQEQEQEQDQTEAVAVAVGALAEFEIVAPDAPDAFNKFFVNLLSPRTPHPPPPPTPTGAPDPLTTSTSTITGLTTHYFVVNVRQRDRDAPSRGPRNFRIRGAESNDLQDPAFGPQHLAGCAVLLRKHPAAMLLIAPSRRLMEGRHVTATALCKGSLETHEEAGFGVNWGQSSNNGCTLWNLEQRQALLLRQLEHQQQPQSTDLRQMLGMPEDLAETNCQLWSALWEKLLPEHDERVAFIGADVTAMADLALAGLHTLLTLFKGSTAVSSLGQALNSTADSNRGDRGTGVEDEQDDNLASVAEALVQAMLLSPLFARHAYHAVRAVGRASTAPATAADRVRDEAIAGCIGNYNETMADRLKNYILEKTGCQPTDRDFRCEGRIVALMEEILSQIDSLAGKAARRHQEATMRSEVWIRWFDTLGNLLAIVLQTKVTPRLDNFTIHVFSLLGLNEPSADLLDAMRLWSTDSPLCRIVGNVLTMVHRSAADCRVLKLAGLAAATAGGDGTPREWDE